MKENEDNLWYSVWASDIKEELYKKENDKEKLKFLNTKLIETKQRNPEEKFDFLGYVYPLNGDVKQISYKSMINFLTLEIEKIIKNMEIDKLSETHEPKKKKIGFI